MARRALVTGCAGFIGSHLAERLLREGWRVTGVDSFSGCYPRAVKERNLAALRQDPRFSLVEADLVSADLGPIAAGQDVIFHHAAQAGVRASWGSSFGSYLENNVLATQRLLEAARGSRPERFVFASSGSVYGDVEALPITEDCPSQPVSPYGVSKLACEHLCRLYWSAHGVPAVWLRYFTVYGPRQRPDMAFHKLIRAVLTGRPFPLYGDGAQTRDFTFVGDVVEATLQAACAPAGCVFNVAGGSRVPLNRAIGMVEEIVGRRALMEPREAQAGDQRDTWADTSAAREALGYRPRVGLREGLAAEVDWLRQEPGSHD